jgi:hypothetical protein
MITSDVVCSRLIHTCRTVMLRQLFAGLNSVLVTGHFLSFYNIGGILQNAEYLHLSLIDRNMFMNEHSQVCMFMQH